MSFVEGLSTSIDVADPAFALCVGAAVLLVTLLLAAPALATALRFLRLESGLRKVSRFSSPRFIAAGAAREILNKGASPLVCPRS